jgi:hypothetical protein
VRHHHADGLLDPQAERVSHTPGDMAAQGAEVARHGAPSLHFALLHTLARLEGRGLQVLQLLLKGVAGRLDHLGLGR